MTATFAALLVAHVLADFVLQPGWMAAGKRRPGVLAAHVGVVLVTAQAASGQVAAWPLLALALGHGVLDLAKAHWGKGVAGFLADQVAHVSLIGMVTLAAPALWSGGCWPALLAKAGLAPATTLAAATALAGAVLAIRAGGFAVGLMMAGLASAAPAEGLPKGGQLIGWLERGLIYGLVLAGLPDAIGFLIAAKSILRFGTVTAAGPAENRAVSEYVIIGTLASFGWAILTGLATKALIAALMAGT